MRPGGPGISSSLSPLSTGLNGSTTEWSLPFEPLYKFRNTIRYDSWYARMITSYHWIQI